MFVTNLLVKEKHREQRLPAASHFELPADIVSPGLAVKSLGNRESKWQLALGTLPEEFDA